MAEIIPAINEGTWEGVKEKIELIAPYVEWVKIDVSDGQFAPTKTWDNPQDLKNLGTAKHVRVELHLMVLEPEKVVPVWIEAGARRIVVHYEAMKDEQKIKALSNLCHDKWVEFGLAVVWQTPVKAIQNLLPFLDLVQVLAVEPGPSGQAPHPEAFERVEELRELKAGFTPTPGSQVWGFKIEWDGGVNFSNIRQIKRAGVDIIAAGSAIFSSQEPVKALEALKRELMG